MRTSPALFASFAALAASASAQVTTRQTVGIGGAEPNAMTQHPDVSRDGRYVAFESGATNLVTGDANGTADAFRRDRWTGVTERVSVASDGTEANGGSFQPSISGDGRIVVFSSMAWNLVPNDTAGQVDVFVRDLAAGVTERVSVSTGGMQGNGRSDRPFLSAEGRYVVFASDATNLVAADQPSKDIFVRDRVSGTTELVSLPPPGGWPGFGAVGSEDPAISSDGRFVAFCRPNEVYLHDRQAGSTTRLTMGIGGTLLNSPPSKTRMSGDASRIAFLCFATNLLPSDTNNLSDVFVVEMPSGTIECATVTPGGMPSNSYSWELDLSEDGRYLAFSSEATNLVPGDANFRSDIFLRDLTADLTELVSIADDGAQANDHSFEPAVSRDGRFVAFLSVASNLVPGDTNFLYDAYLRDRAAAGFTSLCDPGSGGTIACPCANPPSGAGRGCDNSQATGGASLAASGAAYLADDDLVFTTSGERATALSILLQGDAGAPGGVIYGQGVRCAAGSLKRLFTATASGGSIAVPDFGAGDPSVSARSAAAGDPILPGETRWYLAYYRDPIVLGGCPSTRTFNATQTGEVVWSP